MANSKEEGDISEVSMEVTENPVTYMYAVDSDVFRVNLERHRSFVEGRMDPGHGLVDRLQETDAIDHFQVQIIDAETVPFMKSRRIIDFILEGNDPEKIQNFCVALRDTKQQHLLNYVDANGVYRTQFVGDWPLGKREVNIIDKNVSSLKRMIDTACGLLAEMRKHNTITQWQEQCVYEQPDSIKRNTALLEIIRRGSLSEYSSTIDRLTETNQEPIAAILREGGAVVKIHSKAVGEEVPTIKEGEADIVTQLLKVVKDKTQIERDRLLKLAGLTNIGLIAAEKSESIDLFFHCKNLSDISRLLELLKNLELQRIVEEIYNEFIQASTKIEVTLTWNVDEFDNVKRDFEEEEAWSLEATAMETDSQKAGESAGYYTKEEESIAETAAMETDMEKARESKGRPELREDEIIPAIIRNNMDYYTEHIQPRILINKLHSLGIIRDERMRHLRSMSYDAEKIYEVMNIIRAATVENYHRFVQCLRETNQDMVAEVAEKGGVVLKVKVTHEPTENLEGEQKEIVEQLNQLQKITDKKSDEVLRFVSQLKRANIEIASARWDKGIVLWFWCRSQEALATLERLNGTECEGFSKKGSEELSGQKPDIHEFSMMLNDLFTLLLSGKPAPTVSSVFMDNPDRDVVCQKLFKDFPQAKDTKINVGKRTVLSAVKLESKIYVLCWNPTEVLVFGEGDLKGPRQELPVQGIFDPIDMAASNESNCLYITAESTRGVWKISISSKECKVRLWLDSEADDPFTLSVTSVGHVVMVKRGHPPSLDIYHPDTRLLHHLILPPPILRPCHSVETSKGNLIVSYDVQVGIPGGLCEITKEGHLISRVDSLFESINGVSENVNKILARIARKSDFDFRYLAIDDRDQVYVCSDYTDGLLCLDSRLKLETIISRDGLKHSRRVQYVKEENQLIVTDWRQPHLVFILNAK